jgi:ABC-type glycerol-3-phosphate transport system permease component
MSRAARGERAHDHGAAPVRRTPGSFDAGGASSLGRSVLAWTAAAVSLLPLLLIVKQALTPDRESFAWPPTFLPRQLTLASFAALADSVELVDGFLRSVLVAVVTMVATLALALPAAWLAARAPRDGRRLDVLIVVARVFPAIAIAVPLAVLLVRAGLYNRPAAPGLWIAHTLLALPLAFLVLRAGFRAVPRELEEAALLDGAPPASAFLRVTLPLIAPQLATAALLAFLASWDELTYALLIQVTSRTVPPLLYYLSAFGFPGLSSALAVVMLVPALALLLVIERAFRGGVLSGSGR